MEENLSTHDQSEDRVIKFQFKKSPDYSITYISGAICSIAPNWKISLDLFTERVPIPDFGTLTIDSNQVQKFENQYTNLALVREIQKTILLDLDNAKEIVSILSAKIAEFEKYANIETK